MFRLQSVIELNCFGYPIIFQQIATKVGGVCTTKIGRSLTQLICYFPISSFKTAFSQKTCTSGGISFLTFDITAHYIY